MTTGFYAGNCVPPAPVDAPAPGMPSQYGLFSAARIIEGPAAHELNGVEYEPVCSVRVDEWPMNCTPYRGADAQPGRDDPPKPDQQQVRDCSRAVDPMPYPIGRDEGPDWPYGRKRFFHSTGITTALPFGVYAGEDCFLGNSDEDQALADLRERFTLGEQTAVERVIYDGLMGVVPAIRYKPEILTAQGKTNDVIDPIHGIGLLEHWLACSSGATGVIHAPRNMAAFLGGAQEVRHQGPRAVSTLEHTYVFGAGYSGDAPYGDEGKVPEKPDKTWLYATRPVTIRRSALIQPADYHHGGFSLARNESSLLYERIYVVDWPCETAAIQVDYPRYRLTTRSVFEPAEQEQ